MRGGVGSTEPKSGVETGELPPEGVQRMFDRIAPRDDFLNRVLSFRMDVGWRRSAVHALALPDSSRVLDLACGTGDLCRTLAAAGHHPVGLDFSAGMLRAAHTDAPHSAFLFQFLGAEHRSHLIE